MQSNSHPGAFAEAFERVLVDSDTSVRRLARLSGIPRRTLENWLYGRTLRPRHAEPILQIARALRLSAGETDWLLQAAEHPSLQTLRRERRFVPAELLSDWEVSPPVNTPFVGRQREWQRTRSIIDTLQPGDSRCIWIFGEAGIGKTRFAEELLAKAYLNGYLVARTRAYAAHGDLAYAPVAQLLRHSNLSGRVAHLDDAWLSELSRLLPEILVKRPDLPQPKPFSQAGMRVRFFEALCRTVLYRRKPVLLLFDDLQWCDGETFSWLRYLLGRQHNGRLLVAGTYRDDEIDPHHPLRALNSSLVREGQLTEIGLPPLQQKDAVQLAEAVYQGPLSDGERRELLASASGNPLYIIELVRAHQSSAHDPGADLDSTLIKGAAVDLPSRVLALMQYRLGRVSPTAQELLQLAAVSGHTIDHPLLVEAGRTAEENVVSALSELRDKRVLTEQKAGVFDFAHDKLRDVVLAQLGPTQKQLLSRRVAEAYEAVYMDRLDDVVGKLAVAYEGAGDYEAAIGYYHQAAQAETRRGAYERAETYLERALQLIKDAGRPLKLAAAELTIQLSLGNVSRIIRRNKVPKARAAFERAVALSEIVADLPGRFQALFGLAQYHMTAADLGRADHFCRQAMAVAEQAGDDAGLVRCYAMLGFISLIGGKFTSARKYLEQVGSPYSSALAKSMVTLQGEDAGLLADLHLAIVLWALGYSESSDEAMRRAQLAATSLGLPINQAFLYFYQMLYGLLRHDVSTAGQFADRLAEMSQKYDIGFTLIAGRVGQTYAAAVREPGNVSLIEAFDQALTAYREHVSTLSQPFYSSLHARLLIGAGKVDAAENVLEEAVKWMEITGDRYTAVELHRLQGELWALTGRGDAEAAFLRAVALGAEQESRMFQLRAAVSLGRWWQRQGRQAEAHRLLSDLTSWFSEGQKTAELQAARALLDELAAVFPASTARGQEETQS